MRICYDLIVIISICHGWQISQISSFSHSMLVITRLLLIFKSTCDPFALNPRAFSPLSLRRVFRRFPSAFLKLLTDRTGSCSYGVPFTHSAMFYVLRSSRNWHITLFFSTPFTAPLLTARRVCLRLPSRTSERVFGSLPHRDVHQKNARVPARRRQ